MICTGICLHGALSLGIHGQPFVDWDNAKGSIDPNDNEQWLGYCTHASILFPTWHRVYLALVEVRRSPLSSIFRINYDSIK